MSLITIENLHIHCDAETLKQVLVEQGQIKEMIMALKDQTAALQAALDEEEKDIDQVLALVSSEVAQIADLQKQLADAAAGGADNPDVAAAIKRIQDKTAALVAVLPPPAPPPDNPAPAPAAA